MGNIYQLPIQVPGMVGVMPNQKFMISGDSSATITTAGYLNQASLEANPVASTDILQVLYDFDLQTNSGTYGIFTVAISNGVITLSQWVNSGDVLLPVVANHIAMFNGTSGQIYDGSVAAIHGGNIQAGLSGTAGILISFPASSSKGSLIVAAVANTGNTNTTISNAAMGQASVISIPDPSAATANFLLSSISGTQHITSGSLEVDQGDVIAGSSGHAGTLISYPSASSKGSLIIAGVANTGNTNTTISNAAMGQASVISIPDPAQATSEFIIADSAGTQHITSGSLEVDAGNLIAGSSGAAGTVSSFPASSSKGSLILAAVANTGNTNTTISNAAMGQASVISIPDPAAATASFAVAPAALVSDNLVKASGVAGLVADSGIAISNVMKLNAVNTLTSAGSIVPNKVNGTEAANVVTASGMAGVITTSSLTTAAAGSYAITWTNTFISATSVVLLTISGGSNSATNAITFKCAPGSGTATLTIYNVDAAASLNGTLLISYLVI